ncbi:hypothetical protein F511_37446 [Dorcoceras hygrometricum]|uniref:Uncharacterized protein n=1 Tax=Dorcoceras hygrometricum TaxID=472368 RepID=A0A2Z7CTC1_9LAMI|nr:hypothetical protein F511_37446 [Dorcoceras hygrometricum]
MGKFEVVLPHPDEMAHLPPPGFHTFYMNQIEMGLRFPIPRFIAALCHHIKISPSQLAPNSYSFLLALAILLSYHKLPLIPYIFMQLIQIKRLGPGKFYISHKGDHTYIKGNPSSHKGWMSRFFYIKCDSMRDPWRCEMHWRDNVFPLAPRTPDRAPSLTPSSRLCTVKTYNAHIKISPSQLAPNSYSFLLALAVLLSYHKLPLIPYIFMQLIQIKRLGPGKFYISHKGDHTYIKGNPSSHKGWMSRFFYIKCDSMRDPWRCEMHWRDNAFTLAPRTPDRAPSLTPFLEAMRYERMGKAELLRAMQEEARALGEVGPPKKTTKKRKAPSSAEKEVRHERRKKGTSSSGTQPEETQEKSRAKTPPTPTSEEILDRPPVITIAEAVSSGKGPESTPPLDPSKDSLVDSPSVVMATRYICNMAPDRDIQVLKKANDAEVVGHFSANIASEIVWGGEIVKRLTRAHRQMKASRKNFNKAMGQHTEAMARLEELAAHRARELEAAKTQRESLEAELAAEKEARALEREAMVAELERANAWAGQEAERLKSEAREEFLKSPEFDSLLAKKAWNYFKDGFWGCLTQFRANGYSEEEHPASFLDLQQALADMGDEEEAEEEEEEGDDANASPPKSPPS